MAMDETKWLSVRLEELARRAAGRWVCAFTLFLDPAQLSLARKAARETAAQAVAWGGYTEAERQLCAFLPEVWSEEIPWPLAAVVIRWNRRFAQPGHRDFLGSLMALGIKREVLGDILVFDDRAVCFVHDSAADYIVANLERVGGATVTASREPVKQLTLPDPDWVPKSATVASLRLDAVAAAAFQSARGVLQEACAQGMLKLNHVPELRPDIKVKEGDVISFRGHGRVILQQVGGVTKKNRIHIQLLCTK